MWTLGFGHDEIAVHFCFLPMNEDPKIKPIRDLLQDISSNTEIARIAPRGLISPSLINRITLYASIVSIGLIALGFLAMIWDIVDSALALKCIGSIVVLLITLILFRVVNTLFD